MTRAQAQPPTACSEHERLSGHEPFSFNTGSADDVTLQEAVFQALGAASVCWDDMSGTGVFHSERAIDIGEQLIAKIHQLLVTP